ncbi:MAG: cytidylate kinase-like family protein [Desulfobacterales bacterium]|nr:cytidylate kinase-like family protein [Desulfobacterales bacterium]
MVTKKQSVEQFVKQQIRKWEIPPAKAAQKPGVRISVITLNMEPGSGGTRVAQIAAERLGFDYFHRDIIQGIAQSARIRASVIDTIEKERLSGIEDFIASLYKNQYLYPGIYMQHLLKVINAIADHGQAVIVGRGANFILPPERRFSVRVIAPLEIRIQNVVGTYGVKEAEARQRVVRREAKRGAFVRKSYDADISDPENYDLTLNTGRMPIPSAAEAIIAAIKIS